MGLEYCKIEQARKEPDGIEKSEGGIGCRFKGGVAAAREVLCHEK